MTFTESTYLISRKQRKEVSVESLKKVINQFKSNVPDNLGYLKIGGVVFGSEIISTSNLSARYADWDQLVSKYQSASTQSHQTYTQGGLIEAQKKITCNK